MDSEVIEEKIVIAFVYKRSGKTILKESEIYLPLSLELGWFSSQQAQMFTHYALQKKLLIRKGENISPGFDMETVAIPIGFHPSKQTYVPLSEESSPQKEQKNVVEVMIDQIVEKTHRTKQSIVEQIQKIESGKNILPEVATLLVAHEYNVAKEDFFTLVENSLFRESKE